jgi:hypothetical protein
MKRLWLAYRIAPIQRLPDVKRILAKTKPMEATMPVKQVKS